MGRFVALLILGISLLCPGCSGKAPGGFFGRPTPAERGNVLVFGNGAEPEYLDPGLGSESSGNEIARNLWEGLAAYHPVTLDPVPGVAKRWDISPDGTTYTFHLRKDAKWSNGDPVTTQDFLWSWIRVLTPETLSQYATMFYFIVGARDFYLRRLLVVDEGGADLTETSEAGSTQVGTLRGSAWAKLLICDKATVKGPAPRLLKRRVGASRGRLIQPSPDKPPVKLELTGGTAGSAVLPLGGEDGAQGEVTVLRWADASVRLAAADSHWVQVKGEDGRTGWILEHFLDESPDSTRCYVRRERQDFAPEHVRDLPRPPPPAPSGPESPPTPTAPGAPGSGSAKTPAGDIVLSQVKVGGMPAHAAASPADGPAAPTHASPAQAPPARLPSEPAGWVDRERLKIDPVVVGIQALDDHTMQVHLNHPTPFFLELTAWITFRPAHRASVEEHGKFWTRPEHIVCNGPFILTDWRIQYQLVLEPNPHYWDRESVRLDKVVALSMDNNHSIINLYEAGEIDWSGPGTSLPGEYMDFLRTKEDFITAPHLGSYYYWVNVEAKPVDRPKVRRALAMAMDREKIVKYITRAGQIPVSHLVPEGLGGYQPADGPPFDPAGARKLLAEAGYPGGEGLPKIELIYNTSEGHRKIAEAVQQMWKDNLDIEVDISNQEWKVFLKNLQYGFYQVARMGWIGDYRDPYTFLELLTSESGHNYGQYKNPEYDRLVEQALRQPDKPKRLAMYREAEAMAMADMPLLPIYIYTRSWIQKPYLRGVYSNDRDMHPFKHIWIDQDWKLGDDYGADPENEAGFGVFKQTPKDKADWPLRYNPEAEAPDKDQEKAGGAG